MNAKFKILRYNPEVSTESRFENYELEVTPGMVVLDALNRVKDDIDGSISFRKSCRSGICGSCAVHINGVPRLACKTQVKFEMEKRDVITVEPLHNFTPIKDLVVDLEPFYRMIDEVRPWLETDESRLDPDTEIQMSAQQVEKVSLATDCILCAVCYGGCNMAEVNSAFLGPAALTKGWRFAGDSRDGATSERLRRLQQDNAAWTCAHCFNCDEWCPKHVQPKEAIGNLREAMIQAGMNSTRGAKHTVNFGTGVKNSGLLNETTLPLTTAGILGMMSMAPKGIRMLLKRKLKSPIQKPVPEIDQIKRIVDLTTRG